MKAIHGFTLKQIYIAAHLAALGFTFEQFESAPVDTLKSAGQGDAVDIMRAGFKPLLPAQVKLRRTLEERWAAEGTPALRRPHQPRIGARRVSAALLAESAVLAA